MNGSILSEASLKFLLLVTGGVILAGCLLNWGYENDIPVLDYAAEGYDQ